MPEIVDDAKEEAKNNWKPALAYGLATGVGRNAFGPIGQGAGALAAGSYVGGSKGDTITIIGAGDALASLMSGGMNTSGGNSGGSNVTEV